MAFNNLLQITGNLLTPEDPSFPATRVSTLHVLRASGVSLSVTYGSLTGSVTTATALAHLQTETTSCESVNEVGFLRGNFGICVFLFFVGLDVQRVFLEIFVGERFWVCATGGFCFTFWRGYVMFIRYNYEPNSVHQMVNVQQRRWCFDQRLWSTSRRGWEGRNTWQLHDFWDFKRPFHGFGWGEIIFHPKSTRLEHKQLLGTETGVFEKITWWCSPGMIMLCPMIFTP